MKWRNVKLIFSRELRDQLRDRRTLFTVAVMPMLLYPLMGMAMLQVGQFMREHPTKAWLVGIENLSADPQLVIDGKINPALLSEHESQLLEIRLADVEDHQLNRLIDQFWDQTKQKQGAALMDQLIQQEMYRRDVEVAVFFSDSNLVTTQDVDSEANATRGSPVAAPPTVYVFQNSANDKSRIGAERINAVLANWRAAWVRGVLTEREIPLSSLEGIRVTNADVAKNSSKQAAMWSKILPFIIVVWSLTGAFYPAIDLCAGEKERGTFETLLSSPAARSEIAIGKLLTVMSFSMATSLLNLLSMGFTGVFVAGRLGGGMGLANTIPIGVPPLESFIWLVIAMIPISALFSAIALAAAAFARSSKEGQYYLVPLMMISMPLMMVPMLPGARLDLGTSLIPVSGLMLLLRGLIEGQYAECLRYVAPVCAVTLVGCWLSVRWVVAQFNSETVLFPASERFNLGSWVHHVFRDRHALPSLGNAIICGLLILVTKFFIGFVLQTPDSFFIFAKQTIIVLVATIGIPSVLMALFLTRNPRQTLRLNLCSLPAASAAILAAILLNPMFTWLTAFVMHVYPPAGNLMALEQTVSRIMSDAPGLWAILLVFALAPALIEEVAFRGFILSGLQSLRSKWQAIVITSLLFGIAHSVIQQSIITFFVGMFLGVIAVQTRSIIPCILFHGVHNGLAVMLSLAKASVVGSSPILSQILVTQDGVHYQYGILPGIVMGILGLSLMVWFLRLPGSKETKFKLPDDRADLASTNPAGAVY